MIKFFLFKIVRGLLYVHKKIIAFFWQWYNKQYCLFNNVNFTDIKSVKFTGHTAIFISPSSKVQIGKAFIVNSGPIYGIGTTVSKIRVKKGATLVIGDYSGISSCSILCQDSIKIGNHVNIGGGTFINDSNNHSTDWRERANRKTDILRAKTAPIVIGDYAFIGARSIILKGVTIGEKSIVSAGSVVAKDVPPNCIAGGNPCKVIKYL